MLLMTLKDNFCKNNLNVKHYQNYTQSLGIGTSQSK